MDTRIEASVLCFLEPGYDKMHIDRVRIDDVV
jgi:hypothetical protein